LVTNAGVARAGANAGIVIGAYGTPAYLSLTYLMNSRTSRLLKKPPDKPLRI
jgi:hypothetical protein